jgi:hypothetical protein
MALTDVITYAEALQRLGLTPEDMAYERMVPLIEAVTRRLEGATGSYFVQRAYSERHQMPLWGLRTLFLKRRPVQSIASIIDDEGHTVEASEYYLAGELGQLQHKSGWPASCGAWTVSITSGGWWPETALVGEDVKQAACLLLSDGMRSSGTSAGTVISEKVGPVSVTYADPTSGGGAVGATILPGEVLFLMAPYRINVRAW